jgi:uncharacterized membrane protein YiaA
MGEAEASGMMDWAALVGSALWILGLAVCLAALSMARYEARAERGSAASRLRQPQLQLALASGACLICVGLLFASSAWWEKGIWGLFAAFSIVWAVRLWRGRRTVRGGEV